VTLARLESVDRSAQLRADLQRRVAQQPVAIRLQEPAFGLWGNLGAKESQRLGFGQHPVEFASLAKVQRIEQRGESKFDSGR